MNESFRELIDTLPRSARRLARWLPHRLGLTAARDGTFEDFVTFEPNRNLPDFAAPDFPSGDAERLRRFRRAHHFGAFYWLVRDRLADDQTAPDRALLQLGDLMFQRWALALEWAAGDSRLARDVIADATARWHVGTADERRTLQQGAIAPAFHAATVTRKLDWITSAARLSLQAIGQQERARQFQRTYDCFLLGLQCIDDVSDEEEDRALRGCSVPEALGCSPGALLRAAPKLVARAAGLADEGGFGRLGSWLSTFSRAIEPWRMVGDPIADEMEAIALVGQMDGELEDRPMQARQPHQPHSDPS
jgi:hypothetical protein